MSEQFMFNLETDSDTIHSDTETTRDGKMGEVDPLDSWGEDSNR
jgi:hypothetical protein